MNYLKITVDYRETASGLTDLLKNSGALVEIAKLSYGDYIINDTITVERKAAKDFLISIIDGRLFNQMSNLKKLEESKTNVIIRIVLICTKNRVE